MEIFLNDAGNNILFWSKTQKEDSIYTATAIPTEKAVTSLNEFKIGTVLRNGKERIEITSMTPIGATAN